MTHAPDPPLSGVRIIDLTMNMSGPLGTMVLADQGADVVKIEPPHGDVLRHIGPGRDGTTAYFSNLNRNKRSIALDLTDPAGVDVVRRLATTADVFCHNYRPGVVDRLGLDATRLCEANPRLIYVEVSGFGSRGPLRDAPAYDHVIQALSGMAARQAGRDGVPGMVRHGLIDKATGYTLAQATTAALFARERTGRGTRIELSLLETAIAFLWPDGMMARTCLDDDIPVRPDIASSFRLSETADGHLAIITVSDAQFHGLLRAVGEDALADDPSLATVGDRQASRASAMRRVGARLKTMKTAEALARLAANDVPAAPVLSLDAVGSHEQVVAMEIIEEVEHPVLGRLAQARPAAVFDGTTLPRRPSPSLGQHAEEILADAGYTAADIAELLGRRVTAPS